MMLIRTWPVLRCVGWGLVLAWAGRAAAADLKPAPVDEYLIHPDGGIVYDPQRREAESTGQLARYKGCAVSERDARLGECSLRVRVPRRAEAYDVVPVEYELSWEKAAGRTPSFPLAVEAVAFQEEPRAKGRDLFDLALPGRIDLDVEYLGSVTAHLRPGGRHNLAPDLSDEPAEYPPFDCKPLVRSGVVEAGDLVWLKVRFTNTGDTILDPEGLGGCMIYPQLLKRKADNSYEPVGTPYNLYYRDLEYLYPGESHDMWLHLCSNMPGYAEGQGASGTPQGFGMAPGEYKLEFRVFYRCYKTPDVFLNIWEGPIAFAWEMPFTVAKAPAEAPIQPGVKTLTDAGEPDKLTRFIHTFEEFMTAFDCHQAAPADGASKLSGTLYLQVAPWTTQVTVRLIGSSPVATATLRVPIQVDAASLGIRFDPDPRACLVRDGLREPIIASQTMADMRANVQVGPYPEVHIRDGLKQMKAHGINVVATTAMPWLYNDRERPASNYQGDALKYVLDVARLEGVAVAGWGSYPFDRSDCAPAAAWITGQPLAPAELTELGTISHADPAIIKANVVVARYQFQRWGDLYPQLENGQVPIDMEDTRGWMRQDVNVRLPMGRRTIAAFREWLNRKYGGIEKINTAWGTSFKSMEEIDPEKGQVPNEFGHRWEYTRPEHPFHDWSPAVLDLDEFRTQLRMDNYRDTLAELRKDIPQAVIWLRTEGGNVVVSGIDPADRNAHLRHIYFSQRRCALIPEPLQRSGVVALHGDYTTMPYTPSELRRLVRAAVGQGIVPAYLPQFDNMRDIAINARYGSDYQVHYNLPEPRKGYMMHVLTAVYPWFKAVYEEGGIPGILWEDYQCDGFASQTQKREMAVFHEHLDRTLSTAEAKQARAAGIKPLSQEWRKGSWAKWSYRFEGR